MIYIKKYEKWSQQSWSSQRYNPDYELGDYVLFSYNAGTDYSAKIIKVEKLDDYPYTIEFFDEGQVEILGVPYQSSNFEIFFKRKLTLKEIEDFELERAVKNYNL